MSNLSCSLLFSLGVLLVAPVASIAGECSRDVTVKFVANDADRARDWNVVYGRYVVRNDSKKPVEISAYKSEEQPVLLYPLSAFVEAKGHSGRWANDSTVIEHFEPPNLVFRVEPGEEKEFLASSRPDPEPLYRIRLRTTRKCWVTSESFHFPARSVQP